MGTVTTEQLAEWERLANEAERGRRPKASTSEILDLIKFDNASRIAVPQLASEVRRLRGVVKAAYLEGWCDGYGYLPIPPDAASEVSAERCWDESEAKAAT